MFRESRTTPFWPLAALLPLLVIFLQPLVAAAQGADTPPQSPLTSGETPDESFMRHRNFLRSDDPKMRAGAAMALGGERVRQQEAVDALTTALTDSQVRVRANAVQSPGHLGLPSVKSSAAVVRALKDKERVVRSTAAIALGRIAGAAVIDHRVAGSSDAAEARVGAHSVDAEITALVDALLHDKDALVREMAAYGLGLVSIRDERIITALKLASMDPHQNVREFSKDALRKLDQDNR